MEEKLQKTQSMASTIPPKTIGGKDMRTNKTKRMDRHLIKYDVAQK